ncbi:uncharacterized protein BKCO1_5900032 [Diplodia corticola]|uniref:Uncharacterized protein n=1 Tax=Diplodia corticola TaxID=236234 RepID=A0A1J9QRC3_9PEZI|nr:uncharacterized protein BKCO1_5900032 [Diplodia corticola]OJD30562.1 hypothetical protein BKCO1_5900032 [Diplodia corticola]
MPAIFDAVAAAPTSSGGATAVPTRSRRMRTVSLALQASSLVLSVLTMALMANVLYTARNIEVEDPGFVIHRASSALVVWAGTGGILNAVAAGYLIYSGRPLVLNITGTQPNPPTIRPTPARLALALVALARTLAATAYAFADFDRATALALPWDGVVDSASFPSFFTPETYASNQGFGDDTSPDVAARAAGARACCAAMVGLAGVGVVGGLVGWRGERRGRMGRRDVGERLGGGEGGDEEGSGLRGDGGVEVEGREVVEMMGDQRVRAELGAGGGGGVFEVQGKQMHEMEGAGAGAGAHEVQGRPIHEMEAEEGHRRWVYEMDASEEAGWKRERENA